MMRGRLISTLAVVLAAVLLPVTAASAAQRVAVVDGRKVMLVDDDGTNRRRLATVPARAQAPHALLAWSPDGRYLAVTHEDGSDAVVRVYDRRKDRWRAVGSGAVTAPTWSPTSRRLAYGVSRGRIRIVNILTERRRTFDAASRDVLGVHWAPVGKRLAVLVAAPRKVGANLLTMDLNGTDRSRLTRAQERDGGAAGVSWSPDGTQLVFGRFTLDYEASQLVIAPAQGTSVEALTEPELDQFDIGPAWSPTGSRIAFTRNRSVQLVQVSSGKTQRVVRGGGFNVSWSSDGAKLALLAHTNSTYVQAFSHDVASGELTQLTKSGKAAGVAYAP